MVELARKRPLVGHGLLVSGDYRLAPRDLPEQGDGGVLRAAIAAQLGHDGLARDATAGLVAIALHGPRPLAVIGLGALRRPAEGAVTTRLADLRVTIVVEPLGLLLIAERFHADYLWHWLTDRLDLAGAA
jgi:hypothetical protein